MSKPNNSAPLCPICGSFAKYDFSGRDLMFDAYERYDYFRCSSCAGVFLHPMPDLETIGGFYPSDYSVFDEQSQDRKLSRLKLAVLRRDYGYQHLQVPQAYRITASLLSPFYSLDTPRYVPGGRLLDVGCGNGRYLNTMRRLGWDVQGVELSEEGVRACRKAHLPVHHGDLASAALPESFFDLVTVRHVIEHVPDPHVLMVELARILKPGGRLVIETPNSLALGRALLHANWYANDVPRHLILFSPSNLAGLASRYGLKDLGSWLETTPKIFLKSVDYAISNKGKPSAKIRWRRNAARLYLWLARRTGRGDVIHAAFTK